MGMSNPSITLFGWEIGNSGDPTVMYLFTLSIVLVCFFLTRRIIHSPFGAVLEAIRENEERAAFVGINVRRFKLFGWLLACMLAGVAGALFILYKGYIGPTTMSAFAGAGAFKGQGKPKTPTHDVTGMAGTDPVGSGGKEKARVTLSGGARG